MRAVSEVPVEPPLTGDEAQTLVGELERVRRVIAWKCGGLDAAALAARAGASTMTLAGLLRHLTLVECDVFRRRLDGDTLGPPWDDVDWVGDPDWEWRTATAIDPEELRTQWREAVTSSRRRLRRALDEGGLDQLCRGVVTREGASPSLRRLLIDLIEEYARHAGHADLLREAADGLVGEDAPGEGVEV